MARSKRPVLLSVALASRFMGVLIKLTESRIAMRGELSLFVFV